MFYCIARFKRYVPQIDGMQSIVSLDSYTLFKMTEEAKVLFPFGDVPWEEITPLEAEEAWKYYGEVRGYRKAYSDAEGLEPDEDELAKGNRKTKMYITPELDEAIILLMKRIFKKMVQDEFDKRTDRSTEDKILNDIDNLTDIRGICKLKEDLLGIEMPKAQALELGLWNSETNSRINNTDYKVKF